MHYARSHADTIAFTLSFTHSPGDYLLFKSDGKSLKGSWGVSKLATDTILSDAGLFTLYKSTIRFH